MGLISDMKQLVKSNITAETEDAKKDTIVAGTILNVPANHQHIVFGSLTIAGALVVDGTLRVSAWPS